MADAEEPLDVAELHARALKLAGRAVSRVSTADYGAPTPCADWDLRAVLNHVVSGNRWVRPLVEGRTIAQVGDAFSGDLLGNEPIPAYERSADDAQSAFYAPGAMTASCAVSYGPIPGAQYCAHRFVDLVIHGWDLAAAVGAEYRIPADMIEAVHRIVDPMMGELRDAGMFADAIEAAEEADEQTKLLAWFGRREGWVRPGAGRPR